MWVPREDSGFYLNFFQGCILTMEILRFFFFFFNKVYLTRDALLHSSLSLCLEPLWGLWVGDKLSRPGFPWGKLGPNENQMALCSGNSQNFSSCVQYQVGKSKWFISSFSSQSYRDLILRDPLSCSVPSCFIFLDSFVSLTSFFLDTEYNSLRSTALSIYSLRS